MKQITDITKEQISHFETAAREAGLNNWASEVCEELVFGADRAKVLSDHLFDLYVAGRTDDNDNVVDDELLDTVERELNVSFTDDERDEICGVLCDARYEGELALERDDFDREDFLASQAEVLVG